MQGSVFAAYALSPFFLPIFVHKSLSILTLTHFLTHTHVVLILFCMPWQITILRQACHWPHHCDLQCIQVNCMPDSLLQS